MGDGHLTHRLSQKGVDLLINAREAGKPILEAPEHDELQRGCAGDQLCVVIWCSSPLREDLAIIEGGDKTPVIS